MERDRDIEAIQNRLNAIPALRDLQEMYEADEAKVKEIEHIKMDLLHDADGLLSELTGRGK